MVAAAATHVTFTSDPMHSMQLQLKIQLFLPMHEAILHGSLNCDSPLLKTLHLSLDQLLLHPLSLLLYLDFPIDSNPQPSMVP